MTQCRAKSKRTGQQCQGTAMANGVCYHHGGKSLAGAASPTLKHGRYSKHLPTRMLANYEQAQRDPELLNLREDIALIDARLSDLLRRVDSGESGKVWNDLKAAWKAVQRATDDEKDMAIAELGPLIERGYLDTQAWGEIGGLLEQRRKLVESERKRLIEMQQMMTAGQAQLLIARLYDVVTQHVSDRATLAAIGAGLQALAGAGEPVAHGGGPTDN
jgi:hypothetical protein